MKSIADLARLDGEYQQTPAGKRMKQKLKEAEEKAFQSKDLEAWSEYCTIHGMYLKESELYIRWRMGQSMPWEEKE